MHTFIYGAIKITSHSKSLKSKTKRNLSGSHKSVLRLDFCVQKKLRDGHIKNRLWSLPCHEDYPKWNHKINVQCIASIELYLFLKYLETDYWLPQNNLLLLSQYVWMIHQNLWLSCFTIIILTEKKGTTPKRLYTRNQKKKLNGCTVSDY